MSNILILSPFFYPELISTGKYNTLLARGLKEAGAEVAVACSHPLYPEWRPVLTGAEMPGVATLRGGGRIRYPRHPILRRAVLEVWYFFHACISVFPLRSRIDAVVAVFPPNLFFLGVSALLNRRVRRIGVVHDLQGVHAQSHRSFLARAIQRVIMAVERATFNACDTVLVLSEAMASQVTGIYGLERSKVRICYPFVNLPAASTVGGRLLPVFPQGKVHVVYSGAIGDKQNPTGLTAIIEKVTADLPDVHVHIFSEGPFFAQMKARLESRQIRNLSFHGFVPEEDLCELYERSDVQLVPQAPGTEHGSMPSKLPNILYSGKAILAICDGQSELAQIVNRFEAGVCVDSWEPGTVSAALSQLLEAGTETVAAARDRSQVRKLFSIDAVVAAILEN